MSGGLVLLMVGDELLDGRSRDTNSGWIIDRTRQAGWVVDAIEVLPDDVEAICAALLRHSVTARAILVSGGLGPTPDDLTREALARALGADLVLDPGVLAHIEGLFRARGREMAPSNRRQAMRPESSRVVGNPVGSAPGLLDDCGGARVALLPGVPAELMAMFEDAIVPEFDPLLAGGAPAARRIRTAQIAESVLVEKVTAALGDPSSFDLAWCVSTWGVDLLVRDADPERLAGTVQRLRAELGDFVYGEGDASLPAAVIAAFRKHGWTAATAESCTGGLVGAALTSVPGSSEVFTGGVVAYANAIKEAELGVERGLLEMHGAVSEEVAAAMARGARSRLNADWAVSTTGIAGPGGGTPDKPVGTVCIGLAGPGETARTRTLRLGGDRDLVRRWSVAAALDQLRRAARP